jgi:addiction module RelE/StbE family toxin
MVNKKFREVVWSDDAKKQLKEIYKYIKKDSLQAALLIKNKILESTRQLSNSPAIYENDKLKDNNDGNYKAYTIYSYRITYKIEPDQIFILRVRHTSREPFGY